MQHSLSIYIQFTLEDTGMAVHTSHNSDSGTAASYSLHWSTVYMNQSPRWGQGAAVQYFQWYS